MAVTNGWGQGVINNTNGWGKLATNSIDAGSVYQDSASGDTALIGTSAAFSYSASTFTQADADPTPTITGTTGGTFSGTSGLVFVSTSTGEIDLSASTIASHVVTYTVGGVSSNFNLSVTAAPYSNVYSMDFDGVDHYVDIFDSVTVPTAFQSIGNSNSYSISAWIKTTQNASSSLNWYSGATIIELRQQQGANSHIPFNFGISYNPSGGYSFLTFGRSNNYTTGAEVVFSTADVNDGNWHHVAITIDTNDYIFYVDGSTAGSGTFSTATGDCSVSTTTSNMQIGSRSTDAGVKGAYSLFNGQVDEVAVFTSALSSSDISAIYGTGSSAGTPSDLSSLNPTAWYRMGENGVYKSPQWLLPENSNVDNSRFSNYSLKFDGVDDYIDCGDSDTFSFGDGSTDSPFTFSAWVKLDSLASNRTIVSKDSGGATTREYSLFVLTTGKIRIFIKSQGGFNQQSIDSTTTLSTGQWYHIAATYNGVGGNDAADGLTLYINGSAETPTNIIKNAYVAMSNTTAPFLIGKYSTGNLMSGLVDEVAVFNTTLSSLDISSIASAPSDLSSYSPVAYYKMGEEATFVYNVNPEGTWTIPDQVGSNDGTSNNTFLNTGRVGDAPNSTSNAVSFNMVEADRDPATP
tara:strand:+ start:202 stop:2097 length:1896 start_codon:yes stop_codon:yes gene_type:complete